MTKCNHVLNGNSSLVSTSLRKMVHPDTRNYFCPICKKVFTATRQKDGSYLLKKDDKKDT